MELKDRKETLLHINNAMAELRAAANLFETNDVSLQAKKIYDVSTILNDMAIILSNRLYKIENHSKLERATETAREPIKREMITAENSISILRSSFVCSGMRRAAGRLQRMINEIIDIALETGIYNEEDI